MNFVSLRETTLALNFPDIDIGGKKCYYKEDIEVFGQLHYIKYFDQKGGDSIGVEVKNY